MIGNSKILINGYGILGNHLCWFYWTVFLKPVRQVSYNYLAAEKIVIFHIRCWANYGIEQTITKISPITVSANYVILKHTLDQVDVLLSYAVMSLFQIIVTFGTPTGDIKLVCTCSEIFQTKNR